VLRTSEDNNELEEVCVQASTCSQYIHTKYFVALQYFKLVDPLFVSF